MITTSLIQLQPGTVPGCTHAVINVETNRALNYGVMEVVPVDDSYDAYAAQYRVLRTGEFVPARQASPQRLIIR